MYGDICYNWNVTLWEPMFTVLVDIGLTFLHVGEKSTWIITFLAQSNELWNYNHEH